MFVCLSILIVTLYDSRLRNTGKSNADGAKKNRTRDRAARAVPAPEANAELQSNLDVHPDKLILKKKYCLLDFLPCT